MIREGMASLNSREGDMQIRRHCSCLAIGMCLWALVILPGCTPNSNTSTPSQSKAPSQSSSREGSSDTASGASQAPSAVVTGLRGNDQVVPGSTEDAKSLMEAVLARYRTMDRYWDNGVLRLETPNNPPATVPFRVAFERPNRLALEVVHSAGTWTSTTWEGIVSGSANPFPNQRLVRPLPDRIDFDWIASDYLGGLLTEPIGIPIQLEWLLSNQSLSAFDDSKSKLEFLQRETLEGQWCDRVRMEVNNLRWVFWIDRENQLVRRLELPPELFYPETSAREGAGSRCEIDFLSAVANREIDWSRWQVADRPADTRVRRLVMPPPIVSTQILGSTLEPFDLHSSSGELLLDMAEPKQPINVLCWVDSSPKSEACVRELMAFRKVLADQDLQGRCGIFLVDRSPSSELATLMKRWNCDLPLAVDRQGLSEGLFKISAAPSLIILDRSRRVQVAETLAVPVVPQAILDLVRRIDDQQDLASRQMQQDADNQARFIAALHRVAIDKDQAKRIDSIREFQFALHGMRRLWRTELSNGLVSATGVWDPDAAIAGVPETGYPFSGTSQPIVMSALDELGQIMVFNDLGAQSEVATIEIEQADGARRIHMAIDPWSRQWIAMIPEGLSRFWLAPLQGSGSAPGSPPPPATTYNTGELEYPVAFAWTAMQSEPALAIATTESRMLVINPRTEKRLDAMGEASIAIVPSLDAEGRVAHWSALSSLGRLVRIRNLTTDTASPVEARLEQLTFQPRSGGWLWGRHQKDPVTLGLMGMATGETGVAACDHLHRMIRNRPITVLPDQARILSSARLADGTLYGLALGPNRVLHLFTADLQIMDQVSFGSRIFGAAIFADGNDLRMVVALEKEISAWSIDVPDRPNGEGSTAQGSAGSLDGQ